MPKQNQEKYIEFLDKLNDATDQLQYSMKNKWIIDDDTYNLEAFDQCKGAWPMAHPLPLPLWSNSTKEELVVESVIFHIFFCFD